MFVLFIVLNKKEYLEDVLGTLVAEGVRGATIIDSKGMAGAVIHGNMDQIPLFGSLRSFMDGAYPYNTTVFSVIGKEELLNKTVKAIDQLFVNVKKPGAGFMFTMPVNGIYGLGRH